MAWETTKKLGIGVVGLAGSLLTNDAYPAMGALFVIGGLRFQRLRRERKASFQDLRLEPGQVETIEINEGFQDQFGSIAFSWHFGS